MREIAEAYRTQRPAPPFNFVPELLGAGAPHFREADSRDPCYHVQHLALPAGSSYEDLLRLVSDLHEPIYTKTHHSIIDGVSGLKKLYDGLSLTNEPVILPPAFAQPPPPSKPRKPTPALRRLTDTVRGAITQVGAINQISVGALRKGLSAALGSHLEGSLPFVAKHAPTNVPLRQARGIATVSLPLEEMHQIGHRFGATLNDVASTIIDHGLHAYLRETGQGWDHEFIAMVPISLRGVGDNAMGTRVSAMFVRFGSAEAGVTERLEQPGAREIRYLNGAALVGIFPVSALAASIGLNVPLSSYRDHMDFGFVANVAAIADAHSLAEHTRQAYADLKAAAKIVGVGVAPQRRGRRGHPDTSASENAGPFN